MSTSSNCLGCNCASTVRERRLISGPTAITVKSAWKEIIATKVQVDSSLAAKAALVEESAHSGYLCRKCFSLLDKYHKTKEQLLANVQNVLSSHSPGPSFPADSHILVGSKRSIGEADEARSVRKVVKLSQNVARRHLNFAAETSSGSQPVVVSAIAILLQ